MRESTLHREAFEMYWDLGATRSIERLRAELAARGRPRSLRTLYEWSSSFHWQRRVDELERAARQAADEARRQAIREMSDRHAEEALLLQQRGAGWLKAIPTSRVSAEAAIRALVEGARLERLARGEPTERQEVVGDSGVRARFRELTDDQLDHLIDLVARDLRGSTSTRP